MSLASEIYSVMVADTSLNGYIDGGIFYENLPDNFDLKKKWILYYYRKAEQIDSMSCTNLFQNSELTTTVITQNTSDLTTISDRLVEYLNGKESGNIIDIRFSGDGHSFDREKNIYMNTLTFNLVNI